MNSSAAILVASDLRKNYGGVQALNGLSIEAAAGEIHAVLGENGAGKSTLMRVLAGAERLSSGTVKIDGAVVDIRNTRDAESAGIGIVHQELNLFPERSVLANLMVGVELTRFGFISPTAMRKHVSDVAERFDIVEYLDVRVGSLPLGKQQLVELARVLLQRPRLLILDEPNSALSDEETAVLFSIIRELRDLGTAILYVSHRLEEVFDLCDRISVIRSGTRVLTAEVTSIDLGDVVLAMTGSPVGHEFPPLPPAPSPDRDPAVRMRNLSVRRSLRGIDLDIRRGEIMGLVGLDGSGVSTLLAALFGSDAASGGSVVMHDGGAMPRSPNEAVKRGVSLVPADRKTHGLMLDRSLTDNVMQVSRGATTSTPWYISRRRSSKAASCRLDSLKVRYGSVDEPVATLSGGNQQKVVVAKWLEASPQVFLLDDPTRGVDLGGKYEVHEIIANLANDGKAVLLRSSDLDEVIGMSHRVAVFYKGQIVAILKSEEVTKAALLISMNGGALQLQPDHPRD